MLESCAVASVQLTPQEPRGVGVPGVIGLIRQAVRRLIKGRAMESADPKPVAFMEAAWNAYSDSCPCGMRYDENCAHYLTNAFALAGAGFPADAAKCPAGRMIRAKQTLAWFRSFARGFRTDHRSIKGGYWFVYQEKDGHGHVCMHLEGPNGHQWKGTKDPTDWPVQWHFFY